MNFQLRESAHHGFIRSYRANLNENYIDPPQTLSEAKPKIKEVLESVGIAQQRIVICLSIIFIKYFELMDERREIFYFCSKAERVFSNYFIDEAIDCCFRKILLSIDNFIRNGSNWSILHIRYIDLHVGVIYRAMGGGCANICLPAELKKKKAVISINCRDDKCFLHCVCTKLYVGAKKKNRNSPKYKYFKRLNTSQLSFPVTLENIEPFAHRNKLQINVYGYLNKMIYPMKLMCRGGWDNKDIDLLLYKQHFFLITNFNRLLSSKKQCRYYCKLCLIGFARRLTLQNHIKLCTKNKPQKTSMPVDCKLKFKNISKSLRHPFVIYADFESLTEKIHTAAPSTERSFIERIEVHTPISYAMIALNVKSEIIFHEFFVGENAVQHFLRTLKYVSDKLIERMKKIIPLKNSRSYSSQSCVLCGKPFLPGEIRTRHHEHYIGSGQVVGLAHQSCNLNYRCTYFIPVLIHNLKGYDSHLILKHLPRDYADKVQIIPSNMQNFISFSFDHMRFLDSFQFLDASLDVLVHNLNKTESEFKILETFYKEHEEVHLLRRKGIFPYAHFDSTNVLREKSLPPIKAFKNVLTNTDITQEDYEHAQRVFHSFHCSSFSDYLELYQNTDVLLLSEVFESFRQMSLKNYKLDPLYYFTISQLTFDAGLKYTKVELELLGDINHYIFLENSLRGGLCLLNRRYKKANNELVGYKPRQPRNYILPLDAINLYGAILCMSLPMGNFCFLSREETERFDISNTRADSDVGFILEVDLDYPRSCMNAHDDFPLAPEHLTLTYEKLSPYAKELCDRLHLQGVYPCKKLVPNFHAKRNYVTHYLNLKFYIEQGLILRKIHKILAFTQRAFLKDYIQFNNERRKQSDNAFEKSFFKKLNNAFFGKTMENPRKKLNIRAAFKGEKCQKLLSSPLLENFEIVNPEFTIFKMLKTNLTLDKPIFIGFSVLELSKLRMYRLYYENFKRFYKEKCELLYCDTDSLYLNIETPDLHKDLKTYFSHVMDFSNFPKTHPLHNTSHEGELGLLKFETVEPVKAFIGLKAKMYCFQTETTCKKTAKGVRFSVVRDFTFDTYKDILFRELSVRQLQYSIVAKKHELHTVASNKVSLSCFYDKKFLLNNIESKAYGHYKINNL